MEQTLLAALAASVAVGAALTFTVKYLRLRALVAQSKTIPPAPKKGDWIRFLAAVPDIDVEIGDRAQIREVVVEDEIRYIVRVLTRTGREIYASFFEHEAWIFEVIR